MKQIIQTDRAPAAVGPYSQAVVVPCRELIFCAGQIPLDPDTQELIQGDIQAEARRCMDNVRAVLEAAGSSMEGIVKATVYLVDIGDFAAVNDVYKEYFPGDPPARSAVGVNELPKGAHIEIEVIASR